VGEDALRAVRLEKVGALRKLGLEPYPYAFAVTASAAELAKRYESLAAKVETQDRVKVAGRIRSIRNSGMFIDLHDASGQIQVSCHKDILPEAEMAVVRLLAIGDIIGVEGLVRRTPRGELTVNAEKVALLAKALLPLPEKYHGLADIETRYRQRYVDLIVTEESRATLRKRSQVISVFGRVLAARGALEVETPMLHTIPRGASAKPFITHHNRIDMNLYIR